MRISSLTDLRTWVVSANPENVYEFGDELIDEVTEALSAADHPPWGSDWEEWLDENASDIALECAEGHEVTKD